MAPTGGVVVHATQDEGASQPRLPRLELRPSEPVRSDDAAVEPLCRVVIAHAADEGETQDLAGARRVMPQVNPEQSLWLETPGGFLARLAHDGGEQRLAALDVPRRLIEQHTAVDALLNHQ